MQRKHLAKTVGSILHATRPRAGMLTAEDYISIQSIGRGAARRSRA